MSSPAKATLPSTRRTRKSIAGTGRSPSRKAADKENATMDVGGASNVAAGRKKSRSKSIGPGGLDILKSGTGNRRASLAVPSRPPPRSILKPTMPLLPDIPPHRPRSSRGAEVSGLDMLTNPFDGNGSDSNGTKVALRTEEEQQAAAREREERERAELEKEIKDRREARRKSLANRRVSFAAEATLHTFHEVEEVQDSTTSTEATRRASSAPAPAAQQEEQHDSDGFDAPSSPFVEVHETVTESPANQRRRRSSGVSSMYDHDDTMNSTVYDSDVEHADDIAEIQEDISDSSDEEDGTMMTMEEMTSASVASARSAYSSADSSGTIDENLRLAARMAVTQRIDDEEEEVIAGFAGWGRKNPTPENLTQNITTSNNAPVRITEVHDDGSDVEMTMDMDMDMTNAVGGILRPRSVSPVKDQNDGQGEEEDMEMTMEVTRALGGILPKPKPQTRRKSMKPIQQSHSEDTTSFGEQTMEFTMAVGGIQRSRVSDASVFDNTEINEDMSMELTAAIGDVLAGKFSANFGGFQGNNSRPSLLDGDDDQSIMEMTTAVGRILPAAEEVEEEEEEEEEDQTMGMDMTTAVGGILKPASNPGFRSAAKKIMEQEADQPDHSITPSVEIPKSSPKRRRSIIDENGSPGLVAGFQGPGIRRSPARSVSPVAKSPPKARSVSRSPVRNSSPQQQHVTPRGQSPAAKSPAMIGSRSSSPIRDGSPRARMTTPRSPTKQLKLFRHDPTTGATTPRVVLTPQPRRLSGLGVDRPGLGSPRVAEIIDRRSSIGEVAAEFVPSSATGIRRGVAFASPKMMEAELDRERQLEEERENSRRILEREADGSQEDEENDPSINLRGMIQGLSPKKNRNILKGRKSLAVGSARGLLGKRPAELDDDEDGSEDGEERDGIKRLRGHQGSPVKNIRLQSPPTKAETTTGRKTIRRSPEREDENTTTPNIPSSPGKAATTPRHQSRYRNVIDDQPTYTMTMDLDNNTTTAFNEAASNDDPSRIHLQDFLNMTSIRFMELTTTKRRHTIAPNPKRDSSSTSALDGDISLEKCVVAGACTVPMLELYQHSCRELRKYINEGRRIVKDIESETFEENPPLFKEYMDATPEFRILMDGQFKNVKSHARLLSKAMWYEWRMKLQEGLREGLVRISEGMDEDEAVLGKEMGLLRGVLPGLVKRFEDLKVECEDLEAVQREIEECDPLELQNARGDLVALGNEVREKSRRIEELRKRVQESDGLIESLSGQKERALREIREAEKVREECRGWSSGEIQVLKAKVEALERKHGWAITGISGAIVSMAYKREIELVFDVTSFQGQQQKQKNAAEAGGTIDLWYIAANGERNPIPSTPEKEFFLERIRDHVRAVYGGNCGGGGGKKAVSHLLGMVSRAWERARIVSEQIRMLNLTFPTVVRRVSDSELEIAASLLVVPVRTRVEVVLGLRMKGGVVVKEDDDQLDLEVEVVPDVKVMYGEGFNLGKMREFLVARVAKTVDDEEDKGGKEQQQQQWSEVVVDMHRRLLAKGSKMAAAAGGR
ncbi:kinetochore protein spc7 [Rhypophila decipiens]|uniref:Kinetochore protein spc7 n=1 Tax=Rhypophila decipiens TaxID=261697 RepID=A0AAN7B2S5_9PEZI|nr:kinetochore protein spc7 [Rhypophila decipiens]